MSWTLSKFAQVFLASATYVAMTAGAQTPVPAAPPSRNGPCRDHRRLRGGEKSGAQTARHHPDAAPRDRL